VVLNDVVIYDLVLHDLVLDDLVLHDVVVTLVSAVATGRPSVLGRVVGPGRIPLLTLLTALAAAALSSQIDASPGNALGALGLMVGVTLTELRPVHVARRGQRQSFTLTEGPLVAALALAPGRYIVLAIAAGLILTQAVRRVTPYKALFNLAQYCLAAAAAALCAQEAPGVGGVILGIFVFALVSDAAVRLALRVATGSPQGHPFQGSGSAWLLHIAAATSVALIAADTLQHDPYLLPAFVLPGLLIQWSQEQANRRHARGTVATALAQQATTLYGRSSHESAALILRSARDLMTAHNVEIVLLGGSGPTWMRDTGRGTALEEGRLGSGALLTEWRGQVLEHVRAIAEGHWAGVVIGREAPYALLSVNRSVDQEPFRDSDLALLQELADNVEGWLDVEAVDDAVHDTRRRAAEVGGGYMQVAHALGALSRVRAQLESQTVVPAAGRDSYLAEELRMAEEGLAAFVSDLISPPRQRADNEADTVHTGRWGGSRV